MTMLYPDPYSFPIQMKDISIWQDDNSTPQQVDFDVAVRAGVRAFGVKVSQSNFIDQDYVFNWYNAFLRGFKRTGYHFLTWDKTIKEQADTFIGALKKDKGEIEPVADFESRVNAPSASIASERLWEFVGRTEDGLGVETAIYTSPGYWKEFGSKAVKFGTRKLWIANYNVSEPTIPEPWDTWTFWQFGLGKGRGPMFGVESLDIDEDVFNGSEATWAQMYGPELPHVYGQDPEPLPEPVGLEFMVIAGTLNVRSGPGTGFPVIGTYSRGAIVKPLDVDGSSAWIRTDRGWTCSSLNGTRYLKPV